MEHARDERQMGPDPLCVTIRSRGAAEESMINPESPFFTSFAKVGMVACNAKRAWTARHNSAVRLFMIAVAKAKEWQPCVSLVGRVRSAREPVDRQ